MPGATEQRRSHLGTTNAEFRVGALAIAMRPVLDLPDTCATTMTRCGLGSIMGQDTGVSGSHTRVLPATRALAVLIVPFLVVAWWILFLLPDQTERLFAWPVGPPMTARMLAAVYLGGAWFFARVVTAREWEQIHLGFLPVTAFASLMGIATFLHWDAFTSGHISFRVWVVLYITTPLLVIATWWANQRQVGSDADVHPASTQSPIGDGGDGGDGELRLSRRAQVSAGVLGAVAILGSAALFMWPHQLIEVWPWQLSPLTARVMAAMFALGGTGLGIARDPRWRATRLLVQVVWVMLGLILVATVRAWGQFDPGNVLTWVFVVWLVAVLAGSVVVYTTMERRQPA